MGSRACKGPRHPVALRHLQTRVNYKARPNLNSTSTHNYKLILDKFGHDQAHPNKNITSTNRDDEMGHACIPNMQGASFCTCGGRSNTPGHSVEDELLPVQVAELVQVQPDELILVQVAELAMKQFDEPTLVQVEELVQVQLAELPLVLVEGLSLVQVADLAPVFVD